MGLYFPQMPTENGKTLQEVIVNNLATPEWVSKLPELSQKDFPDEVGVWAFLNGLSLGASELYLSFRKRVVNSKLEFYLGDIKEILNDISDPAIDEKRLFSEPSDRITFGDLRGATLEHLRTLDGFEGYKANVIKALFPSPKENTK